MQNINVRPESMARINTKKLDYAFIEEQIATMREQVIKIFKDEIDANLIYTE